MKQLAVIALVFCVSVLWAALPRHTPAYPVKPGGQSFSVTNTHTMYVVIYEAATNELQFTTNAAGPWITQAVIVYPSWWYGYEPAPGQQGFWRDKITFAQPATPNVIGCIVTSNAPVSASIP